MGAFTSHARARDEQARLDAAKPLKAEQAMQAPESLPQSLKEAEEAASKLRAKYRAQQAAAEAAERTAQREADAAHALAAKRQQQAEEHQRLRDDHAVGFVPANRASTDQAKTARATEFIALTLGSLVPLLTEAVAELKKSNATKKGNSKHG